MAVFQRCLSIEASLYTIEYITFKVMNTMDILHIAIKIHICKG